MGEEIGLLTYDLDRVLVGTHRAVGAQAIEQGARGLRPLRTETWVVINTGMGYIIYNADSEMLFGRLFIHCGKDAGDHRRGKFL